MKDRKSRRCRTPIFLALVSAMGLGTILGSSGVASSRGKVTNAYLQAVYNYVLFESPDLTESERDVIVRAQAVQEVQQWPLQERLHHHRLMCFPKGNDFKEGGFVVAVDDHLRVRRIGEPKDVNDLLKSEDIAIESEEDARKVTHFLFRASRVANMFHYGWDFGVHVIRSIDDIKFTDERERATIADEFPIKPPSISTEGGRFRFVFYSWDNEGRGLLERYEVVLDSDGIVEVKEKHYPRHVGVWNPDR